MSVIEKTVHITAPIERVWAALTDPAVIAQWMGDDAAQVDLREGGSYRLFGGETTGVITRVEPTSHLEYTWRQGDWRPDWKDSVVRWELSPSDGGTQVRLAHSEFPNDDERENHNDGWDIYWLEPMQAWLESEA